MFEMSLIYLIGISVPESLLFVWAFYTLSQTPINIKRFFLSVIVNFTLVCGVRLLPIDFGIHTLLLIAAYIFTNILINKINLITSILVTISVIIIQFISEFIDLFIIGHILKYNMEYILSNHVAKVLSGLPAFIFFAFFVVLAKMAISKVQGKNYNK
ncbi:hypothetical protein [Clostridium chromiireducens]|uniref:Rod shape-determining protein MreD n=1 Tax=Clostridium chromiireducens TaxID=225345 RepID=A0A1V4IK10_9CLOT|nr:hypothetical protein [Clostridium chromiireducens]OPJ60085.1 hypothetical protein CLCHR_31610 [Clostridium chromiireducens]